MLYRMYRNTMDPIPLKEGVPMDYNNYPELPEYFGIGCHHNPPPYYGGYHNPVHPVMRQYEAIVPHGNDILMGRGGKNNQHIGMS